MDDILRTYKKCEKIKETADIHKISEAKVRKILITLGEYESDESRRIQELRKIGMTEKEISQHLNMSASKVNSYLPYTKGAYNNSTPTKNAIKIRKHRKKIAQQMELKKEDAT